jgi:hypothetical protein
MAAFEFPDLDRLFTGTDVDPVVAQRSFVAYAQSEVDALISSGQASPHYETYVNYHPGPLASVVLPGPAVFVFSNWSVVINAALEILRRLSESKGKYANSFIVTVDGVRVTDYTAIPPKSEVTIINAQPYTRKMEVGANKSGKRHFERAKSQFNTRFGNTAGKIGAFKASTTFVNAKAGLDPLIPYILRRGPKLVAAKQNSRSSAFREQRSHLSRRKDSQPGQPITYPSLTIEPVL